MFFHTPPRRSRDAGSAAATITSGPTLMGNLQLCCHSRPEKGLVLVTKATIDAFIALPCEGAKSVRFANMASRTDVVEISELSILDPIESSFGKPYYLVGADAFADGNDAYVEPCGVM